MEETTAPDDRLSNHIYHYDTANGMTGGTVGGECHGDSDPEPEGGRD